MVHAESVLYMCMCMHTHTHTHAHMRRAHTHTYLRKSMKHKHKWPGPVSLDHIMKLEAIGGHILMIPERGVHENVGSHCSREIKRRTLKNTTASEKSKYVQWTPSNPATLEGPA